VLKFDKKIVQKSLFFMKVPPRGRVPDCGGPENIIDMCFSTNILDQKTLICATAS